MATSVDIPEGLRKWMQEEIEEGLYNSQSELIRDALRTLRRAERGLPARREPLTENEREMIRESLEEGGRTPHEEVKKELGLTDG